ncbi:MAG: hypothetical protein OXQ29_25010 [Rhodospirillaceae bacterium]|nr:hypothetical protein [Rhodospirillaceae bacterium]
MTLTEDRQQKDPIKEWFTLAGKEQLTKQTEEWLKDKEILKRAVSLVKGDPKKEGALGKDGLSETKVANWLRSDRDIPDALLAGVALYHEARRGTVDPFLVEQAGMFAERFWQVHIVNAERNDDGKHDCLVARYWEGVQCESKLESHRLVHKAWASNQPPDEPEVDNLVPEVKMEPWKYPSQQCEAVAMESVGENVNPSQKTSTNSDVEGPILPFPATVTFTLAGDAHDCGYGLTLQSAIRSDMPDAVHGLTMIPVKTAILILAVPPKLTRLLHGKPGTHQRPVCLETFVDGDPVEILERILGHRGSEDDSLFGCWYREGRSVHVWRQPFARHWEGLGHEVPSKLKAALQTAWEQAADSHYFYRVSIDAPVPHLTYLIEFGRASDKPTENAP